MPPSSGYKESPIHYQGQQPVYYRSACFHSASHIGFSVVFFSLSPQATGQASALLLPLCILHNFFFSQEIIEAITYIFSRNWHSIKN
jgi:hypothetical protein